VSGLAAALLLAALAVPGSVTNGALTRPASVATPPSATEPKAPSDAEFLTPLVPWREVAGGSSQIPTGRPAPSGEQESPASPRFAGQWVRRAGETTLLGGWALGQFIRSGRWGGETAMTFDRDSRTNSAAQDTFEVARNTLRGEVSLRNSTLVLGPRLLVGNVGLNLAAGRDAFTVGSQSSPGTGRVVGYDFSTTVMPDRGASVRFFAARNRNVFPRLFGTAREQSTSRRGGVVRLRGPFIDSTITWTALSFEAQARTDQSVRRDGEDRTLFSYTGTRRTARQTLALEHRREARTDLVFPDLSFGLHTTKIRHGLVLDGEMGGRNLVTTFGLNRRGGGLSREHLRAETRLDFRLLPSLDTRTAYRVERVDAAAIGRESQRVDLRLRHRLYESLVTTLGVKGATEDLTSGSRDLYGGSLLFEYSKKLVAGGRLSATIGRTYDRENNRFGQSEDVIIGEAHQARLGAPFRLFEPRVTPGSPVLSDASQSVIFQEGFDYTIEFIGEFAEISVLPGGRIADGQTVLVDYRVSVSPFSSTVTSQPLFNVTVDYGWISPYFRLQSINRDLLSGFDDGFVSDRQTRTVGVRLRGSRSGYGITLRNERRTEESRNLSFTSLRFGQVVSYAFRSGRALTVTLDEVFTDFRVPDRQESRGSARVDYRWQVTPILSISAIVAARIRRDSAVFDEDFYQAGIDAHWKRRVLDLITSIGRDWGERGGRQFSGLRVSVRAGRSF
jgi:hypothetical protein